MNYLKTCTNIEIVKKEINELKNINALYEDVIEEIIEDSNDYEGDYIERLKARVSDIQHGCCTGVVGRLIYYYDTVRFYNTYKYQIEELILELIDNLGDSEWFIKLLDDDLFITEDSTKNNLAWLAYEEINYKLSSILEM